MFTLLDSSISKSPEGRDTSVFFRYLTVHDASGHKVRFHIVSNSYGDQCSAVAEVWSKEALRWQEVARILPGEMETDKGLFYDRNWNQEKHFEEDYDRLMKLANIVLS